MALYVCTPAFRSWHPYSGTYWRDAAPSPDPAEPSPSLPLICENPRNLRTKPPRKSAERKPVNRFKTVKRGSKSAKLGFNRLNAPYAKNPVQRFPPMKTTNSPAESRVSTDPSYPSAGPARSAHLLFVPSCFRVKINRVDNRPVLHPCPAPCPSVPSVRDISAAPAREPSPALHPFPLA